MTTATEQDIDGHALGTGFREMGEFLEEAIARKRAGPIPEEERAAIKARFAELWQRCNAAAAEYEIAMKGEGPA